MTLSTALKAQDSAMFNPYDHEHEWTKEDLQRAKDNLYDAIYNGQVWDENHYYKADMHDDIEAIIRDREDDKLGRINDVFDKTVRAYANDQVEIDPDKYCEVEDEC